jgi:hypothetical protein
MTNALANVDGLDEARKAVARYITKYGWLGAPEHLIGLAHCENFIRFVAAVERRVTGEHALHSLNAALDEAMHYCIGVVEVLPVEMARELLWGDTDIPFSEGQKGI